MSEESTKPAARRTPGWLIPVLIGLSGLVIIGAVGGYVSWRRHPAPPPAPGAASDAASMIAGLKKETRASPDYVEGWRLLGSLYMQTGQPREAVKAYGKAEALRPDVAEYPSARGEAMTEAADGTVSARAKAEFEKALALDPADPRARYFLALAREQGGDGAGAIDDWIALIKDAPPGAPYVAQVRADVERVAARDGIDVAARLPAGPQGPALSGVPQAGPSAAEVAAASVLPKAQQDAMITKMVDGLAARLKTDPHDPQGWAQLIRSRMVLNEPDLAAQALREGLAALADSPAEQAALRASARDLGVPGA